MYKLWSWYNTETSNLMPPVVPPSEYTTLKEQITYIHWTKQDKQDYYIQDLLSENFDEEIVMAYCERYVYIILTDIGTTRSVLLLFTDVITLKEKCSSHPKFLCIHIAER